MGIDRLGDRLLTALLAGDRALLFGGDGEVVRLTTRTGVPIALVGSPSRVKEVVAQHKSGLLHLVLVGGDEPLGRSTLERCWPFWQISRQLGFHHVDDQGVCRRVKGPRLRELEAAADAVPAIEPLPTEELNRRIEASRGLVEEDERFGRFRMPWVTVAIAAVCVFSYVLQEAWGGSHSIRGLLRMGANPGHAALEAPWTLLSSAFLHIGLEHITLNLAALFSFGPILERGLGARRYLLLYVASALGGGLVSAVGHSAIVSAGASGALWGVMVGGAVLITWPRGALPALWVARARRRVWWPVVLNGIYSIQPGVDWLCHLGGGLTGGLLLLSGLLYVGLKEKREGRVLRLGAWAAALLCLASLGAAWAHGRPWELATPPPLERQWTRLDVSLEVPRGLAVSRDAGVDIFGRLDHDPLAVEVRTAGDEDHALSAAEQAQQWTQLHDALERPPGGAKLAAGPREVRLGGHRAYLVDLTFDHDVTARSWAWVQQDGMVLVRVYLAPDATPAWRALRDSIIQSVHTASR